MGWSDWASDGQMRSTGSVQSSTVSTVVFSFTALNPENAGSMAANVNLNAMISNQATVVTVIPCPVVDSTTQLLDSDQNEITITGRYFYSGDPSKNYVSFPYSDSSVSSYMCHCSLFLYLTRIILAHTHITHTHIHHNTQRFRTLLVLSFLQAQLKLWLLSTNSHSITTEISTLQSREIHPRLLYYRQQTKRKLNILEILTVRHALLRM